MEKRDFIKLLSIGAVAAPVAAVTARLNTPVHQSSDRENSFDRISRTKTIRCAYAAYDPSIRIDAGTKKLSGIFYELTNLIGEYLGFKTEWTEEVGYGVITEGFKTGRYDIFGGAVWPTSDRSRQANFSNPTYYSPVGAYVRKGSHITSLADINHNSVTVVTKDGDISDSIARASFPQARRLGIMQMEDKSQELINVIYGKADVAFAEPYVAAQFLRQHPGALVNIAAQNPVRVFGNVLMFNNDDWRVKTMVDTALNEIQNTGLIQQLIEKYTGVKGTFLGLAPSYAMAQ